MSIGARLSLCFAAITLLMVIGDVVALSQFRILRGQIREISRIDQAQIAVLRVHADLLSFRDELRTIIASEDERQLAAESYDLREAILYDLDRAESALTSNSAAMQNPGNAIAILETIEDALQTQIDTLNELAAAGDWRAVHFRFANQIQGLGVITAKLVDQVEGNVSRQRTAALEHIDRVHKWFLILLPLTAALTLASSALLGILVTRSITQPLSELDHATKALASGNFRSEVPVTGTDELARLAQTFNYASQELHTLYDALSRSELRFRSLIEHSSDLIMTLEELGNIRYVSPSSERLTGYTPEVLTGRNFYDFVHSEDRFTAKLAFTREPVQSVEFRFLHANGSVRMLEAVGRRLKAEDGCAYTMVNARDVTARRRAEEALYQSEKKYRSFFEQNAAPSYIAAADGRLVTCNPAFLRMFGYSRIADLEGVNFAQFYPSRSAREEFLRQLKKYGHVENYQQEFRRKDGRPLYAIANAFGRFDASGELIEVCGFLIDETLRRQTEEQLRQAQKIEAVGRLAGAVAHDFNNLLGIIIGYGQMLLEDKRTPADLQPYVEQVFKAGVHGGELTRQLLAFSRKQVLQPRLININDVIDGLSKMLRRLIGEHISLEMSLAPDLALVKADAGQIEQVIINLAVNSRDAMPEGGKLIVSTSNVELNADFVRDQPPMSPGSYVRISVSDTGVGIAPEILSHVFEPFFSTKGEKGTGLGLATVYSIVKQSGGYIWAQSELGVGSTFSVYLEPIHKPEPKLIDEQSAVPTRGSETILLVEDAVPLRTMTRELLQKGGYSVLEAVDVEHAIQIAEQFPDRIALLVTDVVMPRMSGRLLAERLARRRPEMKVLYMSGYTDDEILRHGILNERTFFIEKPFTRQTLLRKIREVLDGIEVKAEIRKHG